MSGQNHAKPCLEDPRAIAVHPHPHKMPIPTSETELAKLFAELGANAPELWARSQIQEGIPQLLRFLFLKNAWNAVPAEGSHAWIDEEIGSSKARPKAPYAGLGQALARCRALGVADEDLTDIARCLQAQMIFSMGYLLEDGPGEPNAELQDVCWGLFQIDENGLPIGRQISGLHESVLELDPTGREMRPKAAV